MNWSLYVYLGPLCILAAMVLAIYVRLYDRLAAPSERRTRLEVTLLMATIALGIAAIYFNYFDGTSYFAYRDVGSDTVDQYVPYYLDFIRKVGSGTLGTWNMNYGLGASFMSYQSWTLDPFCLVVVPLTLLMGQDHLSLALVIAQSLKMLLCGLLFDHVLTFYCRRPLSRIVGSVLYALCGFLLLWGQHYWISASIVMATLMMLLLELLMRRWTLPHFWGLVLVSCVTLVPYAVAMLQESSRVVNSGQAPLTSRMAGYARGFVPLRWVPYLLSRLLGNGLVSVSANLPKGLVPATHEFGQTNVYEMVQMGFSVGAVILLCQFAWWEARHASGREKVLAAVAGTLCVLYCVNYFLPALSNVFSAVRYRACFALAAPACIAMSIAFERCFLEDSPNLPVLAASFLATMAIIAWSLLRTQDGRLVCLYFLVALVALLALAVARARAVRVSLVVPLLAAILLSSSVVDGFFVTNSRTWCTKDDFPNASASYEADMHAALRFIRSQDPSEPATYRVSAAMDDLNASLAQGFMGVDSYNSTINSNLEEFYKRIWPHAIRGISAYQATRDDMAHPTLQRLLGVRYVLCRHDLSLAGYERINTFGQVRVYKAQGQTSLATVYERSVTESSVSSKSPTRLEGLIGGGTAVVSDDAPKSYRKLESSSSCPSSARTKVESQTHVTCNVFASKHAICMVAIPYARGWSVKVDGRETGTFRTNYGFIGIALKPGRHSISITYRPVGTKIGIAVAVTGLVAALLTSIVMSRRQGSAGKKDTPDPLAARPGVTA